MAAEKKISILIPQFRTLELTKLCLRLLKKNTDLSSAEVFVLDNDSADESLDYLRSLAWIHLLERHGIEQESGFESHAKALDLGLERVTTPYVLIIHTDTFFCSPEWMSYLCSKLEKNPNLAGVGSWKLETDGVLKRIGKKCEDFLKNYLLAPFRGRKIGENPYKDHYYLRSHCALYRTDLLKKHTHGFFDGDTAGKSAHLALVNAGYEMEFLPSEELGRYVRHLNHATMILHPELGGRKTSTPKARRQLEKELNNLHYKEILADNSIDRA